MSLRIIKTDVDVVSTLSFLLGKYQGLGLFQNYPDNFNLLIPQLADELVKNISTEIEIKEQFRNEN